MGKLNHIVCSSPPQERKYRRFQLQYPVRLKVRDADFEVAAVSKNISICGLLVETSAMIPQYTPVSFIVTVEVAALGRPIQFVGEGKVVRVDPKAKHEQFAIAVECARPITQIGHYLSSVE
ncbi:MAG: PilZ domain-containing protein [Terriglobales bacterium]